MFGFLRRRGPHSRVDDFKGCFLAAFGYLQKASKKTGIERRYIMASAFSILCRTLKENFPDSKIEDDSAGMNIVKFFDTDEHYDLVEREIEYVVSQIKACPRDKEIRFIVTYGLIAPQYVLKKQEGASEGFLRVGQHQG